MRVESLLGKLSSLIRQSIPASSGAPAGAGSRETGISLPNNQRQHSTSHAPKDVLLWFNLVGLKKNVEPAVSPAPIFTDFYWKQSMPA